MEWSDKRPAVAGWYWFRAGPKHQADLVYVPTAPHSKGRPDRVQLEPQQMTPGCQWAGPIPQPDEPGEGLEIIE